MFYIIYLSMLINVFSVLDEIENKLFMAAKNLLEMIGVYLTAN